MKLGLMQPYFLPYIGYWQLMKMVDKYVIYDDVNYIKGGWINRNNFLVNKEKKLITISLSDASPYKLIKDIEIKDDFRKFLKTIQLNYGKAPFYGEVFPLIENICTFSEKNLALFLMNSFREILTYLRVNTELLLSSSIHKEDDLKGKDKVIHICNLLGAGAYINSVGGQNLYDKSDFVKNGIELQFLQPDMISYEQFDNEFMGGLSILDVLMFNSIEEINNLLDKYLLF